MERVTRPLQATIAVIAQIGWHPVHPDKWMDSQKANLADLEWLLLANTGISEAIAAALENSTWKSAAIYFLGA